MLGGIFRDNYEIIEAGGGMEAIAIIDKEYDELAVILLDIIMPGIDGLETAEILMKKDENATILMLSSLCDSGTLEEVKAIGLKYLIPKPWEDDVLLATLEMLNKKR